MSCGLSFTSCIDTKADDRRVVVQIVIIDFLNFFIETRAGAFESCLNLIKQERNRNWVMLWARAQQQNHFFSWVKSCCLIRLRPFGLIFVLVECIRVWLLIVTIFNTIDHLINVFFLSLLISITSKIVQKWKRETKESFNSSLFFFFTVYFGITV